MISSAAKSRDFEILSHEAFLKMLGLERKRSERSCRRFVLMLLKPSRLHGEGDSRWRLNRIFRTLRSSTRETDITGWYEYEATIGVIFTEIGDGPVGSAIEALSNRVTQALCEALSTEMIDPSALSFHVYPEDTNQDPPPPVDPMLYRDIDQNAATRPASRVLKRTMDVVGSLLGLIVCAPIFVVLAAIIRLTSKGPMLFRQQRIGQYGRPFTFLKFRSMYVNNDHSIHKAYVTELISAKQKTTASRPSGQVTYKLTGDPRITRIGRFLRRTSLDELPQLVNVLKGDMSLVGPRPPIVYEFAAYEPWHKSRLVAVKPGITGLWQVAGRSRVSFDEMVRLDLRYATGWSLWLDLSILAQTPRAVITGQGAY